MPNGRSQIRLGIVGFGEIGNGIGAGLRAEGLEHIFAYDRGAFEGSFSRLKQARADEAGLTLVRSPAELAALADYIVIATGRSARQVGAMADHLVKKLQPELSFRMTIEGLPQGDWVLLDCGDVVVHLFRPEVRDFYAIEKMWGLEPPALKASEAV